MGRLFAVWCEGMKLTLGPSPETDRETKGLGVSVGWLGDEKQPRLIGIVYRPKARAQGIVLNHCPWCGASLRFDIDEREATTLGVDGTHPWTNEERFALSMRGWRHGARGSVADPKAVDVPEYAEAFAEGRAAAAEAAKRAEERLPHDRSPLRS